ncbi:hypothetical protein JOF53_000008 [Crossiella equi]|uniref:Uncharacterized protein n=1 Tax=Crossiella equi TaxID=130796 RepID=A0ABS5A3I1_9PSEU|nr:hypothetical protein [Crossiella equi]MBP2471136.1 hypothetical protein [Crossiella equi]
MPNPMYPPLSPSSIAGLVIGTVIGVLILAAGAVAALRYSRASSSTRRIQEQLDLSTARNAYEMGLKAAQLRQQLRTSGDGPQQEDVLAAIRGVERMFQALCEEIRQEGGNTRRAIAALSAPPNPAGPTAPVPQAPRTPVPQPPAAAQQMQS